MISENNLLPLNDTELCRIRGADVMNIMMDLMNYAHKFGA